MTMSLSLIRAVFVLLAVAFSTHFATQHLEGGISLLNVTAGICGGLLLAALFIGSDIILRRFNLKAFNNTILGLFIGYLLGTAILFIFNGIVGSDSSIAPATRFVVYLFTAYLGMIMTARAAEEIHLSIPFIEFQQTSHKKKDILVDLSVLTDPRIIDLAASGLIDDMLIVPRPAVKELYAMNEGISDEVTKAKARRSLEVVKKLEGMPTLNLRYVDTDFPEIRDPMTKLVRLARFLDTNIITSDINRIQSSSIEGVKIVNIHVLSNALKPITQSGESINIKIQRPGKEPRQGVGYLDDGTMVVVNGGAEYIGKTIKAQVLSVKHTSSGRMIFCNAAEDESAPFLDDDYEPSSSLIANSEHQPAARLFSET